MFEQALRSLFREAWPKTDIKSPDADSNLQRHFVNNLRDSALQNYLRLHARTDTFGQTVEKARIFVEASELTVTPSKSKPAVRFAETSESEPKPESDTTDKVLEGLEQVLRAVLQNSGPQGAPSSNSGRSSPPNQSSQNNQANSDTGNNPRNRYFPNNRGNNVSNNQNRGNSFSSPRNGSNQNWNWNSPGRGYNDNRQNSNNSNQQSNQTGSGNPNSNLQTDQNSANAGNTDSAPQQQNRNGSRNQRRSRNSGRQRSGCFVCGQLGCHSWFHEQNRNRLSAETGGNQNSSSPQGNNPPRSGNTQARCPSCFNFCCHDVNACMEQWRRLCNLRACPSCRRNDCPGPRNCVSGTQQSNANLPVQQSVNGNQAVSTNQPPMSNSSHNSPNVNWTTVRGNWSPPPSTCPKETSILLFE